MDISFVLIDKTICILPFGVCDRQDLSQSRMDDGAKPYPFPNRFGAGDPIFLLD
jgi:hypothetical protein